LYIRPACRRRDIQTLGRENPAPLGEVGLARLAKLDALSRSTFANIRRKDKVKSKVKTVGQLLKKPPTTHQNFERR